MHVDFELCLQIFDSVEKGKGTTVQTGLRTFQAGWTKLMVFCPTNRQSSGCHRHTRGYFGHALGSIRTQAAPASSQKALLAPNRTLSGSAPRFAIAAFPFNFCTAGIVGTCWLLGEAAVSRVSIRSVPHRETRNWADIDEKRQMLSRRSGPS
jgi:hypothetical protein